jgi:hypothetical protein
MASTSQYDCRRHGDMTETRQNFLLYGLFDVILEIHSSLLANQERGIF